MHEITEALIPIPPPGLRGLGGSMGRTALSPSGWGDAPKLKVHALTLAPHDTQVWIARVADITNRQMGLLGCLLDAHECDRAASFRFESDRRAYVLAHGLRRLAIGQMLKLAPSRLRFSRQANGRPTLATPCARPFFFSHSHAREVVACAVSHMQPVGIDVECRGSTLPDFEWLAPYVTLTGPQQAASGRSPAAAVQFLVYWTALEAFWKAAGTGLSPSNPRIRCAEKSASCLEVTAAAQPGAHLGRPLQAQVSRLPAPEGCVISLAVLEPPARGETRLASQASPSFNDRRHHFTPPEAS